MKSLTNTLATLGTIALLASGCDQARDHLLEGADYYSRTRQITAQVNNPELENLKEKRRAFYIAQREEYSSLPTTNALANEGETIIGLASKYAPGFRDKNMMVEHFKAINTNVWGVNRGFFRIGQEYKIPVGTSTNEYPGNLPTQY